MFFVMKNLLMWPLFVVIQKKCRDQFRYLQFDICFQPKDGEPKIRVLHQEPIQVVDNHFSLPLGKTDQLKAPEHFPPAVQRYTLKEMSLVWYMYGGSDFSTLKSRCIVLFKQLT